MENNDEFRGELLGRLGGGALTFDQLRSRFKKGYEAWKQGQIEVAKAEFKQIMEGIPALGRKYSEEKQYRRAAEVSFYLAMIYDFFGDQEKKQELLNQVSQDLVKAASLYQDMGEVARAVAPFSLAIICQVANGQIDVAKTIYHEAVSKIDDQFVNEKEIIYGAGYLIAAIEQINQTNLLQAQDLVNSKLLPKLKAADMLGFIPIVEQSLNLARNHIQTNTKLPALNVEFQSPSQALLNEPFGLSITFRNEGDGEAKDFRARIALPKDVDLLEGNSDLEIPMLPPQGETQIRLSLRKMTSEEVEIPIEITGEFEYTDMTGASHKGIIPPLKITLIPFQQMKDLESRIDALEPKIQETTQAISEILEPEVSNALKKILDLELEAVQQKFRINEYAQAEEALERLLAFLDALQSNITNDSARELIKNRRNEEINAAVREREEHLKQEFEETLQNELSKVRAEYEEKLAQEKQQSQQIISEMKESFEKEKRDLELEWRMKLDRELSSLKEDLQEKHNEELQRVKNEAEEAIRELQGKLSEVETNLREQLKEEMSERYEKEISQLRDDHEREKKALERSFEERLEAELRSQKVSLTKEFENKLLAKERQIQDMISAKVQQALEEERTKKSQELAEKVREYEEKIARLKQEYEAELEELRDELARLRHSSQSTEL